MGQVPAPPVVGGPVAFMLFLSLCGDDVEIAFPEVPSAWQDVNSSGRDFHGNDGLLQELWPDA